MNEIIKIIQSEIKEWADRNFGSHTGWQPLLGIVEEVGELSHHFLKRAQHIRMHENHDEEIRDAVGDIMVYLCDFCNVEGIDLEDTFIKTWMKVKQRDWKKDPERAHEKV